MILAKRAVRLQGIPYISQFKPVISGGIDLQTKSARLVRLEHNGRECYANIRYV